MERWQGQVAVVTGSSAGIGWDISKSLAEEGMVVVAVARREEKLKELASSVISKKNGKIVPCAADVTKAEDIRKIIEQADALGGVSVIVNNAGIAYHTKISDNEIEKWRSMFELNVFAVGALMNAAIKSMKKHGIDGHIINISSISAHGIPHGITGKYVYNGSKHALRLITEGVRDELTQEKSKIKITMVSPGVVETEIFDAGGWDRKEIAHLPKLSGEDIASACVHVLATPPSVLVADYIVRPVGEEIPA